MLSHDHPAGETQEHEKKNQTLHDAIQPVSGPRINRFENSVAGISLKITAPADRMKPMKVTWFGHSSLLVEVGGKNLLFDPFITPNQQARDVDAGSIPADYVLISHGHQDHLADAGSILKRTGAKLISNYEIVTWYAGKECANGHPLNHGGGFDFDFGRVTYVNAIHSSILPDGSYGGNPGGFVVESAEGNFYFSGDTALTWDMKLFGEIAPLHWAALCIGDNFTMGPRDAARAAEFLGTPKVLGIHYDTFPPIVIDHEAARKQFADRGRELILAKIGQAIDL